MSSDLSHTELPISVLPTSWKERIWHSTWLPGVIAVIVLAVVFAFTLQTDVNGSANDYMIDVGEIQVALNVGGTIHYTGYPLFTMLGTLLTAVARFVGLTPAVSASLSALVWSLLALLVIYRIIWLLTQDAVISCAAVLVLGFVETVWMHSVIAEVYSFSLLCLSLSWWLALRLRGHWHRREWLGLCLVYGTAVAHHRLALLFAPSFLLLVIGTFWVQPARWRSLLAGMAAFLLPFLAYLYLPLRAWQGAVWVYGQPGRWAGFWQQFTGSEVTGGLVRLPESVTDLFANGRFLWSHLSHQLPLWLVGAGIFGLALLTYRQRRVGLAMIIGVTAVCGFVWLFPPAVWAPAALMPGLVLLVAGLAVLLAEVGRRWPMARWLGMVACGLMAWWFFRANQPFIHSLTHDPAGRMVIETLQAIPPDAAQATVALPWGGSFFAAAYGRYVTHELPASLNLVDHRANFRDILQKEGQLLTPTLTASFWPADWWRERLGDVRFDMVAPGVVRLGTRPYRTDSRSSTPFALGNGIVVEQAGVSDGANGQLILTLDWEAVQPVTQNYSVAVHLVAHDPPQSPQDILAQADSAHPVSGYAPTATWQPGEVVHDVYVLPVPEGSKPQAIRLTMYAQDENGQFINNNWLSIPLP